MRRFGTSTGGVAAFDQHVDLFRFIPGYRGVIFGEGKEPLFLLLFAFLIAFGGARGYARQARKRGWGSASIGGVHLHHVVVGIVLVLIAGVVVFTRAGTEIATRDLCAIVFGVGAAFILDEFALVFYLRDVYWANEGRDSVDAAILAVLTCGLLLVVSEPFGLSDPLTAHLGRAVIVFVVINNAAFAVVAFLKAKPFTGVAALALPPFGWIGAARLAKPGSPWARWFYPPSKLARAQARARDGYAARFQRRLVDAVGGEPSAP
jgi:hypothetical protein